MKTSPAPDFYLKPSEVPGDARIRACWVKGRLAGKIRPDSVWVEVDPPIEGSGWGAGGEQPLTWLVLATRHAGASLQPVNESPVYVYICRALREELFEKGEYDNSDVEQIAWGEVYAMYSEATKRSR
jgi:hypothetical protein